jgi:peptide chain release factor 2
MAAADFWSNRERAQADVEEVSRLRSLIAPLRELEREAADFEALQQLALEESELTARATAEKELATEHARIIQKLEAFELRQFLAGENDGANAFVTIHSGRRHRIVRLGDMLLRMYQRWIERSGFSSQTIDIQQGEEVGIKSATFLVSGEYAYGYLQTERGVHRLVRISRSTRTNDATLLSPVSMSCRRWRTQRRLKSIRLIWKWALIAAAAKAART